MNEPYSRELAIRNLEHIFANLKTYRDQLFLTGELHRHVAMPSRLLTWTPVPVQLAASTITGDRISFFSRPSKGQLAAVETRYVRYFTEG